MDISTSYYRHANQELDWLPMDTESLYKKNLIERYNDLNKYGWIDSKFTYKFNSYGFRSEEFNLDPSVVFLGCSLTLGIGLPWDSLWTTQLARELKLQSFNLAIGGSSHDTAFRMAYAWLAQLQPKLVVLGTTFAERLELLAEQAIVQLSPHTAEPRDFYGAWIDCDTNGKLNKLKNILATEHVCQQLGIKFILVDPTKMLNDPVDLARDLAHPGPESNRDFFKSVLKTL